MPEKRRQRLERGSRLRSILASSPIHRVIGPSICLINASSRARPIGKIEPNPIVDGVMAWEKYTDYREESASRSALATTTYNCNFGSRRAQPRHFMDQF